MSRSVKDIKSMSRSVKDVKKKIQDDYLTRSKSRKDSWQSATKSVKTTADVVKLLKLSVKSRQESTSKSTPDKPKRGWIKRSGWLGRKIKNLVIKMPSFNGPIAERIKHMVLPVRLIPQATFQTETSTLSDEESLLLFASMLKKVGIRTTWRPSIEELENKKNKEHSYLARSIEFTEDKLSGIKDYITNWITNSAVDKLLVVDFMNLFGFIKNILGITEKKKIYNIIELMLKNLIHSDGFNRIIICVQNNQLEKPEFIELLSNLEQFLQFLGSRPNSILVLPAINRSSMDDFFVILCSEILEGIKERADRAGYLADDQYLDYITRVWYKIGVTQLYNELQSLVDSFKMLSSTDQRNMLMGSERKWLVSDWYNPYSRLYSRPAYGPSYGPAYSRSAIPPDSGPYGTHDRSRDSRRDGPLPYDSHWRGDASSSRHMGGQGTIKHKKIKHKKSKKRT